MKLPLFLLLSAVLIGACGSLPPKPANLTFHQRYEVACIDGYAGLGFIAKVNAIHPIPASAQETILKDKDKLEHTFHCILAPGEDYPYSIDEAVLKDLEATSASIATIKATVQ